MDDIKERIIDETIERFNKDGLKFTLDELVEGMHISKKTVYKQFGNSVSIPVIEAISRKIVAHIKEVEAHK